MLICTGPRSAMAMSNARPIISGIRSERRMSAWYLVILEKIGIWSVSWKPPRPMELDPVSGVMHTTGECAQ
ncbi:MAG: hypothetical protein A3G73_04455 [Rhodospirillales bacterium RIFCSPLOWO2_12_FULL_67_15]|nr:MAG: hypothetical protein A3G73_04455 [Rhodospirillales bacterium RIFCSPLOWO2_12_FULL_67_15]